MTKPGGWAGGPRGLFSPRQHLHGGGALPHPPTSGFPKATVAMVTGPASYDSWGALPIMAARKRAPGLLSTLAMVGEGRHGHKRPGSLASPSNGKAPPV